MVNVLQINKTVTFGALTSTNRNNAHPSEKTTYRSSTS